MKYEVLWADKQVLKAFTGLIPSLQERMKEAIKELSQNPRPVGSKKLSGQLQGSWRIRLGDYRLIYDRDDKNRKIILLDIDHRRQIYR